MTENKTAQEVEDDLNLYKQELSELVKASKERFEKEAALLQSQMTELTAINRQTAGLNAKRARLQGVLTEFILTLDVVLKMSNGLVEEGIIFYKILLDSLSFAKETDLYNNDEPKRLERITVFQKHIDDFIKSLQEMKASGKSAVEKQVSSMEKAIKALQEGFVD